MAERPSLSRGNPASRVSNCVAFKSDQRIPLHAPASAVHLDCTRSCEGRAFDSRQGLRIEMRAEGQPVEGELAEGCLNNASRSGNRRRKYDSANSTFDFHRRPVCRSNGNRGQHRKPGSTRGILQAKELNG